MLPVIAVTSLPSVILSSLNSTTINFLHMIIDVLLHNGLTGGLTASVLTSYI